MCLRFIAIFVSVRKDEEEYKREKKKEKKWKKTPETLADCISEMA